MRIDDVSVGDYVRVKGYGGFARVLHLEQDGYTPPPNSVPKYRATIEWGPNNTTANVSSKKKYHIDKRTRTSGLVEDVALGRCEPAYEVMAQKEQEEHEVLRRTIDNSDEQELVELIAKLKQQQAQQEANL